MLDALAEGMMPLGSGIRWEVTTATGSGKSAAEAQWKPITKLGFGSGTTKAQKSLALVVVTNDMLRFGGALVDALITQEFRNSVSIASDQAVLATLTDGLTPITSSGDPREDLRKAFAEVPLGQASKPYIFAAPDALKQMALFGTADGPMLFPDISLPNGGTIAGVPTMAVDALHDFEGLGSPAGDCLLVCDAAQLAGDPGVLDLKVSRDASIQMVDNASGTSAAQTVSMFQTSSNAMLAERWFVLSRIRQTAVAIVTGASYHLS